MKSLVVGLGIGNLYVDVLRAMGAEVVTVDSNPAKDPHYGSVAAALNDHVDFDTINICTPNFTHQTIYEFWRGKNTKPNAVAFIEKPGFENAAAWQASPGRKMMVKNNQYRSNIADMIALARSSSAISLRWINNDRVPSPGSWFTDKSRAFGGVSRDLLPHLLSYLPVFFPDDYQNIVINNRSLGFQWKLEDLLQTDYGTVNPNGIYDVDDYANVDASLGDKSIALAANWRSLKGDDIGIYFDNAKIELGLCPEDAYANMIETAIRGDDKFWQQQEQQDVWLHNMMEFRLD